MSDDIIYVPAGHGIEDVQGYRHGGFHPIHLGDTLKNGRYTVRHKLGSGATATVWLVFDNEQRKYFAAKINSASSSRRLQEIAIHHRLSHDKSGYDESSLVKLHDYFNIRGPNGLHTCLIMEQHGPSLASLTEKIKPAVVRTLSLQLAKGIDFLHQKGVAFGDLCTANILLSTVDLDHLSADRLETVLGQPRTEALQHLKGDTYRQNAPSVVYSHIDFSELDLDLLVPRLALADLNEAIYVDATTENSYTGVHYAFASPEFMFGINKKHTKASDIWALACCFYEMRSGQQLLFAHDSEDYTFEVQYLIGEVPRNLYNSPVFIEYKIAPLPKEDLQTSEITLGHKLAQIGDWNDWHTMTYEERRENVLLRAQDEQLDIDDPEFNLERRINTGPPPPAKLSEEEFKDLYDLLSRMLRYEPQDRLTIEEVLAHPWLNRQYDDLDDPSAPWIEKYDRFVEKYEGPIIYEGLGEEICGNGPPPGWDDELLEEDFGAVCIDAEGEAFWDAKGPADRENVTAPG